MSLELPTYKGFFFSFTSGGAVALTATISQSRQLYILIEDMLGFTYCAVLGCLEIHQRRTREN